MQLVANVDGDSCSRVDASFSRDVPWRRWRRSTLDGMLERKDGVFVGSGRRGLIVLSMMQLLRLDMVSCITTNKNFYARNRQSSSSDDYLQPSISDRARLEKPAKP